MRSAGPFKEGPDTIKMDWPGSVDDLIQFIYGNQGLLFVEDAQLFKGWTESELLIAAEGTRSQRLRIRGSWEDT
jgi:hypothetical protein